MAYVTLSARCLETKSGRSCRGYRSGEQPAERLEASRNLMTVRSAVLGRWSSLGGSDILLLTVPAGMTVLIKDAIASNRSGGTANTIIYVRSPDTLVTVDLINASIPEQNAPVQWNGWVVADENSTINAYCDRTGVHIWLSGSLLQGVAQLPPVIAQRPSGGGRLEPPAEPRTSPPLPNVSGAYVAPA
jgi:hypothetical protein